MMLRFCPWLGFLLLPLAVAAQTPAADLALNPVAQSRGLDPAQPTIFIAGDSTAARNTGNPIQGWAVPFAAYFDVTKVNVANRARGGRSSRTFITEGLWAQLLSEVKAGDFVLIQFGHNDGGAINTEPPGSTKPLRARGSLPGLGEETSAIDNAVTHRPEVVHTFGWYIRQMIADVKARGATPIVLSLTVREYWHEGKIERGSGPYRQWDRQLAEAAGISFVDLSRIVADEFQALGPERVREFFAPDHTHLSLAGADRQAAAVVAGLKGLRPGWVDKFLSAKGRGVPADDLGWLNLPEPADARLPSIVLIGDSTVRNGRGDGAGGQWGWGDSLGESFDPAKINVVNRAVGGLSSRTYLTLGHWARALTLLKPGDFVVLQFGHNDGSPVNDDKRARGTLPGTGEDTQTIENMLTHRSEVVHSYGWYLRQFIREARAAGATPVVCSPVPRKIWLNGKIARPPGSYAEWARQVAAEENVAFIDLHALVAQRYDALGPDQVNALFADPNTHTSRAGAELNASVVAAALHDLPGTPFAPYLKAR